MTLLARYQQNDHLAIPYKPNQDFGSPRFRGIDPYQLMFTLYQNGQSKEPKGCVAISDSASGTKSKTCE